MDRPEGGTAGARMASNRVSSAGTGWPSGGETTTTGERRRLRGVLRGITFHLLSGPARMSGATRTRNCSGSGRTTAGGESQQSRRITTRRRAGTPSSVRRPRRGGRCRALSTASAGECSANTRKRGPRAGTAPGRAPQLFDRPPRLLSFLPPFECVD